ncbi:MAG: carboxypeptidase-like regulatory domain-containing protein [Patescibacteria group bacterium]
MSTQSIQAGENDYRLRIYGLKNLKLTEGQTWQMTAGDIKNLAGTQTIEDFTANNTVSASVDPIVNYITNTTESDSCYNYPCGNVGDTITITGSNYATSTDATEIYWNFNGGSVTSTVATASATALTATIPTGLNGRVDIIVSDLNTRRVSDSRPFIIWNSTQAIFIGSLTSNTAGDIDRVQVEAFTPGQMGNVIPGETHSNGKYALLLSSTGSYNVQFGTPAGATYVAPSKLSSQTATVGSVATLATQAFRTATLSGTVKNPSGTTLLEGVEVVARPYTWDYEQRTTTGPGGTWKLYVPNDTSSQCYEIEARPKDYQDRVLQYKSVKTSQCLTLDQTAAGININLTSQNVKVTIKAPGTLGDTATASNPQPGLPVPYANVGLHTMDWSYNQWAQADSDGVVYFGGVTDSTHYILELEPPFSGDFRGYSRTRTAEFAIDVTDGQITDLGNKTFTLPNVFGKVKCGGIAVENAWVNMNKDGSWYGVNTDANGNFSFGGVLIGTYNIQIQPPSGGTCASGNFSVSITSNTSNDLKDQADTLDGVDDDAFTLSAPNVTGVVKDPTGTTGQSGIWIDFCPYQSAGGCYGTSAQSNGTFSLSVPTGNWNFNVNTQYGSLYAAPQGMVVNVAGTTITEVSDPGTALTIANNSLLVLLSDPTVNGLTGRVCKPKHDDNSAVTQTECDDPAGYPDIGAINVGINMRLQGSMSGSQWSQTDANGNYAIGGVAVGTYEIEANPWNGCGSITCGRKLVQNVAVTSSQSSRTKNIILSTPNITGTVVIPNTTTTVANAWINFHVEGPMQGAGGWYGTNTDQNGQFSFGGVSAGTYALEIEAPRWGTAEEQAVYRNYSTKKYSNITISSAVAAGTANLDLGTTYGTDGKLILGTPQVTGRVMNPGPDDIAGTADDQPLQWSWIMIHDQMWQNQGGASTDDQGYFRIGGLTNATGLSMEINLPWGGGKAYIQPSGLTVDVTNDVGTVKVANVAQANNLITLTVPTKTLTGTVTKKGSGLVVANARVQANRDMGGGHFETLTDANGEYTLKLAGGGWWLGVNPDWSMGQPDWVYNEAQKRTTFTEDGSTECRGTVGTCPGGATILDVGLDFEVQVADAIITGLVKDPTGATAIANSWVMANSGGMMGGGNGTNTDSDGRFTFKVPAGTYDLVANPNWGEQGQSYGGSTPVKIKAISTQTTDAGTLILTAKNSHIKGTVTDSAGNAIGSVMVNAWQMNGPGWANTMTATNTGRFDLTVSEGNWGVMIMPMSTQYIYQGGPQQVTITANQTSDNNDFLLKVADGLLKVKIVDADGNRISDIWGGVWVKDTDPTVNDFIDFGDPKMMEGGSGDAGGGGSAVGGGSGGGGAMGAGMDKGGFAGGGLANGYTEIKVPLGSYELGLNTPPGSKYTLTVTKTVTVGESDTCTDETTGCKETTLVVAPNNATIEGKFYLDTNSDGSYTAGTDTVVTGVRAFINGDKENGGWSQTEFAPSSVNDKYSLKVSAGSWYVDAFIDPMMNFGDDNDKYKIVSEDVKSTVIADSTTTRNFQLKKLDKTISGTITDPDDVGISGVWVYADFGDETTKNDFKGPGGLGVGTFTGNDGTYTLNVTSGTFKIGAGIPPWDARDLINPPLLSVTVGDTNVTGKDLQFSLSDATITGEVTLDSVKKQAMIQAWSEDKGTGTMASDGTYTLKVKSGETWYVKATAKIDGVLYESAATEVITVAGAQTKNLTLITTGLSVPEAKTTTFSASDSKTIELTNGLTLEIPAGALASSGTVTVTITPTVGDENQTTVSVKPDAKDKPLGVNYDFTAKDSNGQEITQFDNDVKITFPYDPDLITDYGYTEADITPKYFDDTTNTWENYKSVVRDATNNVIIVTTNHFTPGGITGGKFVTAGGNDSTPMSGSSGGGGNAGSSGPKDLSLKINSGAAKTTIRSVSLNITATDAAEMMISNTVDFAGINWEPYQATRSWLLPVGKGEKVVYIRFRDKSFNLSSIISAIIISESEETAEVITYNLKNRDLVICPTCTTQSGAVYMILNNETHVFPHLNVYLSWGYPSNFSTVKKVTPEELSKYSTGIAMTFRDGSLFRGKTTSLHGLSASAVFMVSDGKLRPVKSSAIYQKLFNDPKWKLVTWVPDDLLSKFNYPLGDTIDSTTKHPNGTLVKYTGTSQIYLIQNGKKYKLSAKALTNNGYSKAPVMTISKAEIYSDGGTISDFAENLVTPKFLAAK